MIDDEIRDKIIREELESFAGIYNSGESERFRECVCYSLRCNLERRVRVPDKVGKVELVPDKVEFYLDEFGKMVSS